MIGLKLFRWLKSFIKPRHTEMSRQAIIAKFVHDMRTPLLTTSLSIQAIRNDLSELVEGYNVAKNHKLINSKLKSEHLVRLSKSLEQSENQMFVANRYLNKISICFGDIRQSSPEDKPLSVRDCMNAIFFENRIHPQSTQCKLTETFEDFDIKVNEYYVKQLLMSAADYLCEFLEETQYDHFLLDTHVFSDYYALGYVLVAISGEQIDYRSIDELLEMKETNMDYLVIHKLMHSMGGQVVWGCNKKAILTLKFTIDLERT